VTDPDPLAAPNSGAERGALAHPIKRETEMRVAPNKTLLDETRKRFMPNLTGADQTDKKDAT